MLEPKHCPIVACSTVALVNILTYFDDNKVFYVPMEAQFTLYAVLYAYYI